MTRSPRRVAVLLHENERRDGVDSYAVGHLAEFWRRDGLDVRFLWGVEERVPADVLLVHVNLSVVPDAYLEFARSYPVALNAGVRDVRKSAFSANLLTPGDAWDGPVIVKSDLNYAGRPERKLLRGRAGWLRSRLLRQRRGFRSQLDYRVYARLADVPRGCFRRHDLVVERFLPERDGELYCVRTYQFLGPSQTTARIASRSPIVSTRNHCRIESIEPDPAIVAARHAMAFDYGKFDYVLHEGRPVLLDANKTTGAAARRDASLDEERRRRAAGIHAFLDGSDPARGPRSWQPAG